MIQVQLKLRLRPAQERQLERWLFHLTGVFNWAVRKIELDANDGIYHSKFGASALVRRHGARIGLCQDAVDGAVFTAYDAWRRCFKRKARRPVLKGRRNRLNGITFPRGSELQIGSNRIRIPVLGFVRYEKQSLRPGRVSYARIVRRASGWYACLFVNIEPADIPSLLNGAIGIDPGFSSLLTLSTGEVVDHPHELRGGAERLAQAQRGRRCRLAARLLERQANRRRDRNHKLSRRLVQENSVIVWSRDNTRSIQRTFGKSVASAAHHQLRQMLAYKSRAGGRQFIEVDSRRSTMTCSACGARSGPTGYAGLSVRRWTCGCGASHDRDVNAALNTLRAGLGTSLERVGDGSYRNCRVSETAKFKTSPP
jgi:putative transposase